MSFIFWGLMGAPTFVFNPIVILNTGEWSNLNLETMFGLILFFKITQIEQWRKGQMIALLPGLNRVKKLTKSKLISIDPFIISFYINKPKLYVPYNKYYHFVSSILFKCYTYALFATFELLHPRHGFLYNSYTSKNQ